VATEIQGINFFEQPNFKKPFLLAGWPGMGIVATQAVDYIRRKLRAVLFAEIDTRELTVPYSIIVSEGLGNFPDVPKVRLYYSKKYDLVICQGEEQFSGKTALKVAKRLLDLAKTIKVKKIFTGAAFVQHMNHRSQPSVYTVSNSPKLREWLVHKKGMNSLRRGQISGLNGSILGFAAKEGIEAACFLSTIPIYAVNLPNPKAARAIVDAWQKTIGFSIDLNGFDRAIRETDHTLQAVEEQLKKLSIANMPPEVREKIEENEIPIKPEGKIPEFTRKRIEYLFETAKKDKRLAHHLKEELDKWNIFKEYEDRFLDLFRDSQ